MTDPKQVVENLLSLKSARELAELLVESFTDEGLLGSENEKLRQQLADAQTRNVELEGRVAELSEALTEANEIEQHEGE